jgi:hypothetical protein
MSTPITEAPTQGNYVMELVTRLTSDQVIFQHMRIPFGNFLIHMGNIVKVGVALDQSQVDVMKSMIHFCLTTLQSLYTSGEFSKLELIRAIMQELSSKLEKKDNISDKLTLVVPTGTWLDAIIRQCDVCGNVGIKTPYLHCGKCQFDVCPGCIEKKKYDPIILCNHELQTIGEINTAWKYDEKFELTLHAQDTSTIPTIKIKSPIKSPIKQKPKRSLSAPSSLGSTVAKRAR